MKMKNGKDEKTIANWEIIQNTLNKILNLYSKLDVFLLEFCLILEIVEYCGNMG